MGMKCIGVNVGGTSVKIGLFETTGELLDKWEVRTHKEEGGRYVLPDVAWFIRDKMEEMGLSLKTDLAGIGLRVPGPAMPGGFVEVCVSLGWCRINPQEEFSSLLDGATVKSGSDANVVALGEMWQGGSKGYKDLATITLGTGMGGGVIIDRKIITGRHGFGGEIDHIHIRDEEQEHCNCGGVGCMEQICSATGITRETRREMETSDKPSILREHGGNVMAKDMLDAVKAGDELANEVMGVVGRRLGLTLSVAVMIVNPETFAIGRGVSKVGQFPVDVVQKRYDYFTPISKYRGKLGLAILGNDAGIYGVTKLVLQD